MGRFLLRHWTAAIVVLVLAWWALFYLPGTPAFAVFQLKRAIDARDGERAAQFVDFESVVKHAGYEMLANQGSGSDPLGQFLGKGAVELFSKPVAGMVESWAEREVNQGAKEVQMPGTAVAGALVVLHRNDDTAYTDFRDRDGKVWEIHMARSADGRWQIVEVKNIQQLLEKLQREQQQQNAPVSP
ncbi:MAG TPA: DUF2939 domain-containing protein [Candidatus Binataceae bacterium]|nr:DUF2939 domain-containing protein [Candidatus Binataceae bacterium]